MLVTAIVAQAQTFQVIHSFEWGEGVIPSGFTLGPGGNLYGTAPWAETITALFASCSRTRLRHGLQAVEPPGGLVVAPLFKFNGSDGGYPDTSVTFGPNGSIYGSTSLGGSCTYLPFMAAAQSSTSRRAPRLRHRYLIIGQNHCCRLTGNDDGCPYPSAVIFDSAGNLYGTTIYGTYNAGNVFEFTRSGGYWTKNSSISSDGGSDGQYPKGVLADAGFNHLFGITFKGGNDGCGSAGCGTIFELTRGESGWTKTTLHTFADEGDGAWPEFTPIMGRCREPLRHHWRF